MVRPLTIASGVMTAALLWALSVHDHTLSGARAPQPGAGAVTKVPDKPAFWPPLKPPPQAPPLKALPPTPVPKPLHRSAAPGYPAAAHPANAAAAAFRAVVDRAAGVARTLLNLPKHFDGVQVTPTR
jgi:hypothetical protein